MSSAPKNWLSLKEAADMLGVHPTTLRRWADNGDIPVYVTPGGHRRFLEADIEATIENRLSSSSSNAAQLWAKRALTATQSRLQDSEAVQWLKEFEDAQRIEQREMGSRLLNLIMQHITLPDEDDSLLNEARSIAALYANNCMQANLNAAQALEIVIFFRDSMLEAALKLPQVSSLDDKQQVRLVQKINQVFNHIQLALVDCYSRE